MLEGQHRLFHTSASFFSAFYIEGEGQFFHRFLHTYTRLKSHFCVGGWPYATFLLWLIFSSLRTSVGGAAFYRLTRGRLFVASVVAAEGNLFVCFLLL